MWPGTCRIYHFFPQISRINTYRVLGLEKCFSTVPEENVEPEKTKTNIKNFRFKYLEFLPNPEVTNRNPVKEKLERRDMLRRRNVINIPEFYVGSVLAVTTSDKHASNKMTRFVGICIKKTAQGVQSQFVLRNIVDNIGVEVGYLLYSPVIQQIEVLKLEKRLDDELLYLRNCPPEYSTFPFDMTPEYHVGDEVPVNTIKVPINPRPWPIRFEIKNFKGAILPELSDSQLRRQKKHLKPWEKYDLMDQYRKNIPEEEQKDILEEISDELQKLELKQKVEKRKKEFKKVPRQKLF